MDQLIDAEQLDLSGNDKNKITGKQYQPVMSITGLNDQGLRCQHYPVNHYVLKCKNFFAFDKRMELADEHKALIV